MNQAMASHPNIVDSADRLIINHTKNSCWLICCASWMIRSNCDEKTKLERDCIAEFGSKFFRSLMLGQVELNLTWKEKFHLLRLHVLRLKHQCFQQCLSVAATDLMMLAKTNKAPQSKLGYSPVVLPLLQMEEFYVRMLRGVFSSTWHINSCIVSFEVIHIPPSIIPKEGKKLHFFTPCHSTARKSEKWQFPLPNLYLLWPLISKSGRLKSTSSQSPNKKHQLRDRSNEQLMWG